MSIHQHVILIAKLIANLLHSIAPTAISGLGSLGFGGMVDRAEAVYLVEIDHCCSSSHINAVCKLQKRAMLLLTVKTLSLS